MDPQQMPRPNGHTVADTAADAGDAKPALSYFVSGSAAEPSGGQQLHEHAVPAQQCQPGTQPAAVHTQHAAMQQPTDISAVLRALHERSSKEEEHETEAQVVAPVVQAANDHIRAEQAGNMEGLQTDVSASQGSSYEMLREDGSAGAASAAGRASRLGAPASTEESSPAYNMLGRSDMSMPDFGGPAWQLHCAGGRHQRPVLQLQKGNFVHVGGPGVGSFLSRPPGGQSSASHKWQEAGTALQPACAESPRRWQPQASYSGEHEAAGHAARAEMPLERHQNGKLAPEAETVVHSGREGHHQAAHMAVDAKPGEQQGGDGHAQQQGVSQEAGQGMEIDPHGVAQPAGTGADHALDARALEHPGHADQSAGPEIPMPTAQAKDSGAAVTGGRRPEIKPETDAGMVVWAKTPRYPWWPAQVLAPGDPWIPADMEMPRRGAVPVRFFGTYNFCWIESQRALAPFTGADDEERTGRSKLKVFQEALQEAVHFAATGEEPAGFQAQLQLPPNEAHAPDGSKPVRPRGKEAKGDAKKEGKQAGKKPDVKRRDGGKAAAAKRASAQRKLKAMRAVGLAPPGDSPYTDSLCLDVARKWLPQALAQQRALQLHMQQQQQRQQQAFLQQQLLQRRLQEQALMQQRQSGLHPQIVIYRPQLDPNQAAAASQPSVHSLPQ